MFRIIQNITGVCGDTILYVFLMCLMSISVKMPQALIEPASAATLSEPYNGRT